MLQPRDGPWGGVGCSIDTDARLQEILSTFFIKSSTARDLVEGFNAPLGTFSARAAAAFALGLIQENEFKEITIIRKIRNEFGHGWQPLSFASGRIRDLVKQLPWLGPQELEAGSSPRARFNFAIAILLTDLLWRVVLWQRKSGRSKLGQTRHVMINAPNQAMEQTAARLVFTFQMIKTFSLGPPLIFGGSRSSSSR